MSDEPLEPLDPLARTLANLRKVTEKALGFVETLDYRGIRFFVTRRFVTADLTPLTFFHLVEHLRDKAGQIDAPEAIARLYERLGPLLTCRHEWTPLSRASDQHVIGMAPGSELGSRPHICKRCTAYVLGGELPLVGKSLSSTDESSSPL